jgi:hypothetical protein
MMSDLKGMEIDRRFSGRAETEQRVEGNMATKQSQVAEDLAGFYEATLLDLPIAAVQRLTGAADEKALSRAGWKAYDAWIRLANEFTNQIYANRTFAAAAGGAFETLLRAQRAGDALSSAFFGNLWPALGIPTVSQVNALRDEVIELRDELRARSESRRHEESRRERAADESLRLIWNGSEHRPPADGHRGVKEAKNNVAA